MKRDDAFKYPSKESFFWNFQARPKRKRRLIVDNIKSMSGDDIKSQMFDTEDILSPLDLAPPTKKLMVMQEVGATERMFGFPGLNVAFVHIKKI